MVCKSMTLYSRGSQFNMEYMGCAKIVAVLIVLICGVEAIIDDTANRSDHATVCAYVFRACAA